MLNLSSATQAAVILLREGLEALLVIGALAAFLSSAQAPRALRALYLGVVAAIVASLIAAAAFALFLDGAHDDRLEAGVMILAAILMLYMSGWLLLKQDGRAWMQELRTSAEQALSTGALWTIGLISFFAVFREGAETVLFLHALASSEGGWNTGHIAGLLAAAVALGGMVYAMQWLTMRLPLRPIFLATSALLFVMALRFIGGAIQELQEQAILGVHEAPGALYDGLMALGFNATLEAITVQGVVIAAAIASFALLVMRKRAVTTAAAE
jgi:high-affinity iron transporter